MRTRFLFFFLLCGLLAKAQTIEVTGFQSGIWKADTVLVTGNIVVQDSLIIAPGTTVLFKDFYSIMAEKGASLKAIGTETDSILFTVADTTGFHLFNLGRGGWNGIRLTKAGQTRFDYCRFQFGKAALDDDQDGGALRIYGCNDVEISNSKLFCNFSREHGGALSALQSNVVIHDCAVTDNLAYSFVDTIYFMYGGAMRFHRCDVTLTDVDFFRNIAEQSIGGAVSLDSCAVHIDRCRFENNCGMNGAGLYLIRSNDYKCSITNSLFANNMSMHFGGGLAISDSSPEMSNLTVVGNHSVGVNCGGIFFYQYSSPVVRNCIVYGNTNEVPLQEPVQMWCWTYENEVPKFFNCLIQYGLENISGNDLIHVYENNLDTDPLFVDAENADFRLREGSPCINSGYTRLDDLSAFDMDGHARVCGGIIDLGAYEFSGTGIGESAQNEQRMRIVGNPVTASSYAEVELDQAGNLLASLYSSDGKLLKNRNLGNFQAGTQRIELGELFQTLPAGSYLLTVRSADKTFVAKLVK